MKRPGQTLLELVIASGVISVSVIAALTLILRTIDLARQSQQTVEAGNLAREGVEVVRMIRDSNWLDFDDNVQRCGTLTLWDSDGQTSPCNRLNGSYIATFDAASGWALRACSDAACSNVKNIVIRNGYATQSLTPIVGATPTAYQRVITIQPGIESVQIPPGGTTYQLPYLDVSTLVTWTNATRRVAMHERLYNWR